MSARSLTEARHRGGACGSAAALYKNRKGVLLSRNILTGLVESHRTLWQVEIA